MISEATDQVICETPVEFSSEGAVLRGVLLTPMHPASPLPAVIMTHGTTATIKMVAIEYARVFARVGLAVLIYDHRNFGTSSGEPRQQINPWIQARGYVDALDFLTRHPEIDADRIALWGDSYSGGHVILVAACDSRPRAVVAQVPVLGQAAPTIAPSEAVMATISSTLRDGDVAGTPETTVGPMPVVSSDQMGTPSLLLPIQAYRWFIEHGGRPGSGWRNIVTRVIPPTPITYSPYLCAPFVQAPILLMVAPEDEMLHANYQVTRSAFDMIPGHRQWYDIADGHFGLLYQPGERFDEASDVQAAFLRSQLAS